MMFACKSYVLSTEQSCVYGTNAGAGITMVVVVVIIIFVVTVVLCFFFFFFSSRRRHTTFDCDWSSYVCSSDLDPAPHQLQAWQRQRLRRHVLQPRRPRPLVTNASTRARHRALRSHLH